MPLPPPRLAETRAGPHLALTVSRLGFLQLWHRLLQDLIRNEVHVVCPDQTVKGGALATRQRHNSVLAKNLAMWHVLGLAKFMQCSLPAEGQEPQENGR